MFLGWSLTIAAGLPLITLTAAHLGWQAAYGAAALMALLPCLLVAFTLPAKLRGEPLSLASFMVIARHRKIMLLLLMTLLGMTGQFVVFVYLSPLLRSLADAGATTVGLFFAIYGVTGFLGNVIASGIVGALGARLTSLIAFALVSAGMLLWALAGGLLPLAAGMALWGLGFAASNSMQQARLVAAAPTLSSATVALNTSVLYVGQAAGSALGTLLYPPGLSARHGLCRRRLCRRSDRRLGDDPRGRRARSGLI